MPAKLSKQQFLDAKRVIKESKTRLSNEQVVKRAKLGSEKTVPTIRKARSYPHYCELVREKNRAAKQRRDERKNGQQASLLAVDAPTPPKKKIEVRKADDHEPIIPDSKAKVDPEEEAAMRERIAQNQTKPVRTEDIVADLMRRVSGLERGQRGLYAGQKELTSAVAAHTDELSRIITFEHTPVDNSRGIKVKRKKLFGIF